MELLQEDLITHEEYAVLAVEHSAVARLETYDELRAVNARLRKALDEAPHHKNCASWVMEAWPRENDPRVTYAIVRLEPSRCDCFKSRALNPQPAQPVGGE